MCREAVAQFCEGQSYKLDFSTFLTGSAYKLGRFVFDKEIKAGAARRSSIIAVPVPDATFL